MKMKICFTYCLNILCDFGSYVHVSVYFVEKKFGARWKLLRDKFRKLATYDRR